MSDSLPGGKRTVLNVLFLVGNCAAAALGVGAAVWAVVQAVTGTSFEDRELSFGLYAISMAARFFFFAVGGIVFLMWLHRSYANTQTLSSTKYSPGWVAFSFFIPVLQLVRPYSGIQEIWRNSESGAGVAPRNSRLILAWWLLFLAWESIFFIAIDEMPEDAVPSLGWWVAVLIGDVCGMIAAALGVIMVISIRRRQKDQAARQQTMTYSVPAPPLTYPAV